MDLNFSEFHFIRPLWWLALLPYLIVLFLLFRSKLSQGVWTSVCDPALLPYLLQDKPIAQSRWPFWCGALAGFLAIFALTGPTWERLPTPVFRNDAALVIALDMSKTMDAGDIKPSRLIMARYKIADILKQRKDGQTALLVFAGDAFIVTPLTNDTETIANQLTALTTEIMPADGNNITAAIEKSVNLLKQAGLQKGQILLVTDGGELAEADVKPLGAYQLLILGAGTASGAPIAMPSGGFMKNLSGDIIVDKLDVPGLEKLAAKGGASYQSLTVDDSDIKTLLTTVAATAKEQGGNKELLLEQWRDNGPWLLLAVLPLAALSFRKGLLMLVFCALIPLPKNTYAIDVDWEGLWQTKDQQAQKAYNNQQYDKAAELYENPDWKAAAQYKSGAYDKAAANFKANHSADSHYNQGNALAQFGQLQEALDAYDKALELNPNDEDAKYNKALVEQELQKQQQKQPQDQQQKKDKDSDKDSTDDKNQAQKKDGDKSGQSEGQQSQEKKEEQNQTEQKPEQKQEQSQQSTEQQPEKQESDEEQQKKSEPAQQESVKESPEEKKPENSDAASQQPVEREMSNEEKQAIDQWLKRIPDDPAGLLRRKFKYQYDQRNP